MLKISTYQNSSNFKKFPIALPLQVQQPFAQKIVKQKFAWLKDEVITAAMTELYVTKFDSEDVKQINELGLNLPFHSGSDVVNFLSENNVRITFAKINENDVHAHYDYEKNIVCINDRYKNNSSTPVVLAIAEAILHETGHAKDNDAKTSVQEELECLAMNAIAHRDIVKRYSDVFYPSNEPIINDGVRLYAQLFFDNSKSKNGLILRVREKYGNLPVGDNVHPPSQLALRIKNK